MRSPGASPTERRVFWGTRPISEDHPPDTLAPIPSHQCHTSGSNPRPLVGLFGRWWHLRLYSGRVDVPCLGLDPGILGISGYQPGATITQPAGVSRQRKENQQLGA